MHQVMLAIWEAHYPYFTEKGQKEFDRLKGELLALIQGDGVMNN